MATRFEDIVGDLVPERAPATSTGDRISQALRRSVPRFMDINRAVAEASTGQKSFGEIFNAIQAGRIRQESALLSALNTRSAIKARDRRGRLAEERLALDQERLALDDMKTAAQIDHQAAMRGLQEKRVKHEGDRVKIARGQAATQAKNIDSQIKTRERDLSIREGKLILEEMKQQGADGLRVLKTLTAFLPNPVERAIVMDDIAKDPNVMLTPQNHAKVIGETVTRLRSEGKITGQKQYKPLGRIRAEARAKAEGEEPVKAKYRKPDVRTTKITELVQRNFTTTEAQDIVDGRIKATAPDSYGNIYLVNIATGQVTKAEGSGVDDPRGAPKVDPKQQGLGDGEMSTLEKAIRGGVGPWRSLGSFLDATVGGLAEMGSFFPKTAENRQFLREFNQIAKTVLVNNPRFPVAEQNIVARMLPDPDRFWQNPETSAKEANSLRSFLMTLQGQYGAQMSDPLLTLDKRAEIGDRIVAIGQILALMNAQMKPGEGEQTGPAAGTVEDGYRFKGGDPADQSNWEKVE